MVCGNCSKQSNYVKLYSNGQERCHHCGGFSEAGGARVDGILTRQTFRVRSESYKNEGDTILPHKYSKITKRLEPNPDFVKQYPDRVGDYFDEGEITRAGLPKLAKHADNLKQQAKDHKKKVNDSVEFVGKTEKAVEKAVATT